MRQKRFSRAAAVLWLDDRSLKLQESAAMEEIANRLHDPRHLFEAHLAGRLENGIEVAFAKDQFAILHASPLVRQRTQRFRQNAEFLDHYRNLAALRLADRAGG